MRTAALWVCSLGDSKLQSQQSGSQRHTAGASTPNEGVTFMGDKSPKSVQKQASQKQVKAKAEVQKKQQAAAAKKVASKK
jgi:hypothetical protein